ncbi:MAG: hypothetical protein CM15mP125_1790 [Gammaproteobacteria bacterium]|nr:MAG: hypothetical protein CM15mP125_1790 [Gammaproteobacteria bacterium]
MITKPNPLSEHPEPVKARYNVGWKSLFSAPGPSQAAVLT